MRKMSLVEYQSAFVQRAAWWSRELTRFRARGPGDIDNAMRALERDYGLDYWSLWRLRYRLSHVRDVGAALYHRLEEAYLAECERQRIKLDEQIARARKTLGPAHPVVVEVQALARNAQSEATPKAPVNDDPKPQA